MILILMQNGWSTHYTRIAKPDEYGDKFGDYRRAWKDRVWSRQLWIDATWTCKTGQVLRLILGDLPIDQIWLDNTTLELAPKASGIKPPDIDHVVGVLYDRGIRAVVACSKQAGETIDRCWAGPLLKIPHPAYRGFTREGIIAANARLKAMLTMCNIRSVFRAEVTADGGTRVLPGDVTTGWDDPWITQPQLTKTGV